MSDEIPETQALGFERLASKLGVEWPAIADARSAADDAAQRLRQACESIKLPPHTAFIAFGSLARKEWTSGSDVDWTLLIDGPSDPEHLQIAQDIAAALADGGFAEPGATDTFGSISSSHDLIHYVGGPEDTNQNMTRRILLLLESVAIGDGLIHGRVIRQILKRYIVLDPAVSTFEQPSFQVPLFLLNDIVRLWRTMAVDYATKKWQRAGEGWAIRNIKLRMSRKLLFVKGLLMCFLCKLDAPDLNGRDSEIVLDQMVSFCVELSGTPAIDVLCDVLVARASNETAKSVVTAYNEFLESLNDSDQRKVLKELSFDSAASDDVFQVLRTNSHEFRDGLESLFFEENEDLAKLTKRYGVF